MFSLPFDTILTRVKSGLKDIYSIPLNRNFGNKKSNREIVLSTFKITSGIGKMLQDGQTELECV